MKYDPKATANGVAITAGTIYIVCRVGVAFFPDLLMTITQLWFHGLELARVSGWNLSLGSFVLGLISLLIVAWLVGYFFANSYNYFVKK